MKKILVIEDTPEIRENLAEILELDGYQVFEAENGKVGVQLAQQEMPDLIICDVMMPELDGFGVLKILDKKPETATIPFIFLTAKADKADIRKGMNLGADDYITKPFDDVELMEAIEMRLKKSERLKITSENKTGGFSAFIDEAKGQKAFQELSLDRQSRRFNKKENIYMEGDFPLRLYYIVSGKVKTFKSNEYGKELLIEIYKEGDFMGINPLIAGTKYGATATALEPTEVSYIPKEDFYALLYSNRDFSAHFVKLLAQNVREREQHLIDLAYNSVRKKVADALLMLYDRYEKEGQLEEIAIQRDDLAAMVGTAKETVIRTISDFKEEGILGSKGNKLMILNKKKLENMPN